MQIEGIPASDINGLYGGSEATDNSDRLLMYLFVTEEQTLVKETKSMELLLEALEMVLL